MKFASIANLLFKASKHALASAAIVGGFTGICTLAYFFLVFVGIVFFGDMGGPLNIVLVPLLSFALSFVATAFFIFPSTFFAERICGTTTWKRTFAQVPVSCALLFVHLFVAIGLFRLWFDNPGTVPEIAAAALVGIFFLAIPLGAYWWMLKSADTVRAALSWTWRLARRQHSER